MAKIGIQHMNKDVLQDFQKETDFGEIELDIGNDLFNFQWAEFAPPSGVMAANYSRNFHSAFSIVSSISLIIVQICPPRTGSTT